MTLGTRIAAVALACLLAAAGRMLGPAAPGAAKFLEDAKAKSGENSLAGKMAAEFLLMQGP
jgi:hypothetical protein